MSITLQFNVREGDTFHYQSTFTSGRGGAQTSRQSQRVARVAGTAVHLVDPDDPEALVTVLDRRGYPVDFLQGGVSIKDELAEDAADISNSLIFPDRPVDVGDTWEADDGTVRVAYRLVGVGQLRGREAAEIHAAVQGYTGPIKHWVELATGMPLRKEYLVGAPGSGTTTVTERV